MNDQISLSNHHERPATTDKLSMTGEECLTTSEEILVIRWTSN